MKKLIQNGKHLIYTDAWFVGPDGEFYNAAFGNVEIHNDEDALGIKTNARSSNWFAKVGTENSYVIIAGCQIHYAVRCDEVNEEALNHRPKKETDDWTKARIWKPKESHVEILERLSHKFMKDVADRMFKGSIFPIGGFMSQLPYNEVPEILKEINEKGDMLFAELRQDSQLTDATHYYGLGILENLKKNLDAKEVKIGVDVAKPGGDKTVVSRIATNNPREDLNLGTIKIDLSDIDTGLEDLNKVLAEMKRQDEKFGADRNLPPGDWISILTEEVGEVAREWNDAGLDLSILKQNTRNYEAELVQVAAVALQAIKNIKKY